MSQEKAQLIAPIDNVAIPGINATGVITATSFVGDSIGTSRATGLINTGAGTSNLNVGVVTATKISGPVTGNITGTASSIISGSDLAVGVATAVTWLGDGSGLTGVALTGFVAQEVTASGAETIINLDHGNLIYLDHNANTTIGFASTASGPNQVILQRTVDNSYTITWPGTITWNGGAVPTLLEDNSQQSAGQIFQFNTIDSGLTWNAYEIFNADPQPNTLWTWGDNSGDTGMLGLNDIVQRSSPTQVSGTTWVRGDMKSALGAAIKTDSTLWVWGRNHRGQLGLNQPGENVSSPTQVPGTTWSSVNCGENGQTFSVKTDGTLWICGRNNYGQAGLNNLTQYSSPMQIGTDTTWTSEYAKMGGSSATALKTDGTLWSWGYNANGCLGHNIAEGPTGRRSSPTQIGTDSTWSKIDMQQGSVGAIKTDGTLWVWGDNEYGQLGLNTPDSDDRSSPAQIPGTTWISISINHNTVGRKSDGTLWAWGTGLEGALGQNDRAHLSSPTQVPGTTWNQADVYFQGMLSTKTDGTLWMWGNNEMGELGLNQPDSVKISSPTQVGTDTNWGKVIKGKASAMGFRY